MAFTLRGGQGVAFIVSAEVVWAIIAFACSSPQTAEMNIGKRAKTLMKWVHLGQALALATIAIGAAIDPQHRRAIVAGGVYAMVTAEAFYIYAKASGLANPGEPTEEYPA